MTFALQAVVLALAWFVVANAWASALVALLGRSRWAAEASDSRAGAAMWLALRLFPAMASTAFVVFVFLPSFWRFEPRGSQAGEDLDRTLPAFAALGLLLLTASVVRGAAAWMRAVQRTSSWMAVAEPAAIAGCPIPAFRVSSPQPLMALAGILRPRLLVTTGLVDILSREELEASVAHEIGHHHAWDNLKRLAMRAAPDFLTLVPAGRFLEQKWAAAAEHVADQSGAHADVGARLALASALVKIARLTPPSRVVTEPISTLVGGGAIASRVHRLVSEPPALPERRRSLFTWSSGLFAALVLGAAYPPLLRIVHAATEVLVNHLP